jgi:hypothetical protein
MKKMLFSKNFLLIIFLIIFIFFIIIYNYLNKNENFENINNLENMYYSTILFTFISDLNLTQYHNCEIDIDYLNSKNKLIIFCLNTSEYFNKLKPFLKKIKKPFVLITAMDDSTFPTEMDSEFMNDINENEHFKHWFAINKIIPNDNKFTSIPYGLDHWTITTKPYFGENIQSYEEQNNNLQSIIDKSQHFTKRIPKIYANFHLNKTDGRHGEFRSKLINIIPNEIVFYEPSTISRTECYNNMIKYSFVVSPYGNGYDCIRSYEALCLGCIVILKKDFLNIIYEDLPVLFVDNWEDINEELLNKTLISYSSRNFNYDKLKMNYWIKLINSKLE